MKTFFSAYASLRNGKLRARRRFADAPLVINTKTYFFNHTRLGRLSAMSSNFFHELGKNLLLWFEYKMTLHHWRRKFLVPSIIAGGFFYGYFVVSDQWSGNMYERGYNMPKHQPVDFTHYVIKDYGKKEDVKYMVAHK